MLSQRDIKSQVIKTSEDLFYKFGFQKVSVDEIVAKIGISKKTFYKYFASKEMLVIKIIENNLQGIDFRIKELFDDENLNYMEKIEKLVTIMISLHAKFSIKFMQDIIKYIPDILEKIKESGNNLITENFRLIFQRGVEENFFRKDVDPDLFVMIHSHIIQKMHDPALLTNISYSFKDIHKMVMKILFEGVLTEEARKKI